MKHDPIDIVRVIRRLRGGSQPYLVEGQDSRFYVAKFTGNPQGTRTLINEWFTSQVFQQLGIMTPPMCVLRLTKAVQQTTADLGFCQGKTFTLVAPGLHLGSQCPVNPETTAIFDFLPRHTFSRVANPNDFAKTLVLDLFLGQTDVRQAIFVREGRGNAFRMRAYMIDHGWTFGGSLWQLCDSIHRRLCWDHTIYSFCNTQIECERIFPLVSSLTDENLNDLARSVPAVWFSPSDQGEWARVINQLSARKRQLPGMLQIYLQQLKSELSGQVKENHWPTRSPEPETGVEELAPLLASG